MYTQVILKSLLIFRAAENQPAGPRKANAVTEHGIQSPGNFVDEIIHVAFQAAIVVAGEDHAPLFIDNDPPGEVDGLYPGEIFLVENVASAVIRCQKDAPHGQSPEPSRLDITDGSKLVLCYVILKSCEILDVRIIRLEMWRSVA